MTEPWKNRATLRLFDNSDASWRQFGRTDPYYGVLSTDEYRAKNLNAETIEQFFDSGERHIEDTLRTATGISPGLKLESAMDFGCGAGRLVVPLARRFARVAGVDISPDYLAEAKRNCEQRGLDNAEFAETVQALRERGRTFDFMHSCIVFNHIPWSRGRKIIEQMFGLLNPGGVMAIGVLHYQETSKLRRLGRKARKFLPLHYAMNILSGRPALEPLMQIHEYPLDQLIPALHRLGAQGIHIQPLSNEMQQHWAVLFCTREAF